MKLAELRDIAWERFIWIAVYRVGASRRSPELIWITSVHTLPEVLSPCRESTQRDN